MLDRRQVLSLTAAAGLAPAMVLPARAASSFAVGSITARVFSDGFMTVGPDRLVAAPQSAEAAQVLASTGAGTGHRFALNVTHLSIAGRSILVDAGAGGTWVETAGKLGDGLQEAAIAPADIDVVVLTHGHPDHLWGVIDDFDDTVRFAKAKYVMPRAEYEFWTAPGRAEALRVDEGLVAGARRVLGRIADRLTMIDADEPIVPGLAFVAASGHTPGHCAVMATSGSDSLLIAADTIFHPVVSVEHPEWSPQQDMDPAAAVASRRRILDLAAARQALVIAYHVARPGAGRIERNGNGFRWRQA